MKLTMLGTGNAMVTDCYNTCFVLEDQGRYFMVDAGGGNGVLIQLKRAGIPWREIRDLFVTHKHVDHILGAVWMMRLICQNMKQGSYTGEARIYAHREVAETLLKLAQMLLQKKQADCIQVLTLEEWMQMDGSREPETRLCILIVEDGQSCEIAGHEVTFFDIHSTKAKQFGFSLEIRDGERLTCCGDEPFREQERTYAQESKWLMHEAFCLYAQADRFHPYEKHHSTAKDAAELAESLQVQNLILYHTEDQNLKNRKALYTQEGSRYFSGNLYVPEDLETLEL